MALIFCDSFDHYNLVSQKWTTPGGNINFGPDARTGIGCLIVSGLSGPSLGIPSATQLILGAAINTQGLGFAPFNFGLGSQLHVQIEIDGSISFVDGSGTRGTSVAGLFSANSYQYLEVKIIYTIGFTGTATIRLNGQVVLTSPWNINIPGLTDVFLRGPGAGLSANIDDLYLCDTSGTVNNDFLGAVRIYAEVPVANGTPIQFTPSDANPNWQIVSAVPPNLTEDVSGALGNTDQYVYHDNDIPAGSLVFGVQHCLCAQLDIAGSRSISSSVGGVVSSQQDALTLTPTIAHTPYDKNPATSSAWALTDFPGTQIGPSVTA